MNQLELEEKQRELWDFCCKFLKESECDGSIYNSNGSVGDWVLEESYYFIETVSGIVAAK